MSEISSFRFWCQKVLPAVYDDSLSYYELLCKVVAKLNEVINSQNGTNDHVTELAQQFEQLKNGLQGTIESEAEKIVDNYVKTNNLVKSVNGITAAGETGNVTLQASDVGAIANVNDSVKSNNIMSGSVTGEKIATGAVGSEKIAQDAVTKSKLANGSVATAKIQDGAVTADKLAQDAVPVKSVNGKTGEVQIGASEVGALPNTAGSVGTTNLQDGAVTGDKIADDSITDSKIPVNSISGNKIKTKSITQGNLANNSVGPDQISKKGIMTENLADTIITEPKLAAGSVTNEKVADGTIALDKFANQGAENAGKLLKIDTTGKVVLGSGTGQVTAGVESVNGKDGVVVLTAQDVGAISNADNSISARMLDSSCVKSVNGKVGNVTLTAEDIDGALQKVAPSNMLTGQTVDGAYLFLAPANGETDAFQKTDKLPEKMLPEIDGSKIKTRTIKGTQLAAASVTNEKIGFYAVTANKIDASAVTEGKIADGAVTEDKIANGSVGLNKMAVPGVDFSGMVLVVNSSGNWELQKLAKSGEWEEIPAASLIGGATVHCRIQPGTGWLWFSITSNDGTQIKLANAKGGSASAATTNWGTINVNVCNKPVPPNGSSTSSDSYPGAKNTVSITGVTTATINETSVSKLLTQSTTSLTPSLTIKRNNTGVTLFGVSSTSSTAINGVHGDFFIQYWFDNRTADGSEAYPSV